MDTQTVTQETTQTQENVVSTEVTETQQVEADKGESVNTTEDVNAVVKNEDNEAIDLPKTLEEFEIAKKAAANKANTEILKSLGVKSVKDFKELQAKANEALTKHEELVKQSQDLIKEKETLSKEYETLKQTSILDRLAVKPEYRDDLVKLAKDKVDGTNSFESVLKNLIDTKYQHAVLKNTTRIGVEKTTTETNQSDISPELQKKYTWLK